MEASAAGNRPRWTGGAGFFEIWFLVVFDPRGRRAWWLRYTTFAPAAGRPGAPRATVWAAAFDAAAPAIAAKAILPATAYAAGRDGFQVRIGDATLGHGSARGEVATPRHRIAWDLSFAPRATAVRREPRLLHLLPAPTRVAHANDDVAVDGWVTVDGVRHALHGAPAVQKHIWGTRRVEEIVWLYGPRFADDPSARLEATSVRVRRGMPALTTMLARSAHHVLDRCGLGAAVGNRVETDGPRVTFRSAGTLRRLVATAWCDPATFAGYVYRDPSGFDVHVAQSDVASCTLEVHSRPHPFAAWQLARRHTAHAAAALELHAPAPLPGIRYLGWDDCE
jgi:hypothetical protein